MNSQYSFAILYFIYHKKLNLNVLYNLSSLPDTREGINNLVTGITNGEVSLNGEL